MNQFINLSDDNKKSKLVKHLEQDKEYHVFLKLFLECKKKNIPLYIVGGVVRSLVKNQVFTGKDIDVAYHKKDIHNIKETASLLNLTCIEPCTDYLVIRDHVSLIQIEAMPVEYSIHVSSPYQYDFTISTLYYCIMTDQVHDPLNAIQDIENRTLNVPCNLENLQEFYSGDVYPVNKHNKIMRFFRFLYQGYKPKTNSLIRESVVYFQQANIPRHVMHDFAVEKGLNIVEWFSFIYQHTGVLYKTE
jgi:hypothetical protein